MALDARMKYGHSQGGACILMDATDSYSVWYEQGSALPSAVGQTPIAPDTAQNGHFQYTHPGWWHGGWIHHEPGGSCPLGLVTWCLIPRDTLGGFWRLGERQMWV